MHRLQAGLIAIALMASLTAFNSVERLFAPSAELWERWQNHDAASRLELDHGAWDALLARYVKPGRAGINRVDYDGFSAADSDRAALDAYIHALGATAVSGLNRAEQMAYWINLYNALTMQVVLAHFPVDSIRDIDISPGVFSDGPWGKKLITVEGEALSLNDIEHRILRPIWRDPRVHYAVNCAAIGCPNLAVMAYTGAAIDNQLTAAAWAYVNDPRGVEIAGGEVTVSKIYDWFIEDFGGSKQAVLKHLLRYAEPDLHARLTKINDLADARYDWSLNRALGQ